MLAVNIISQCVVLLLFLCSLQNTYCIAFCFFLVWVASQVCVTGLLDAPFPFVFVMLLPPRGSSPRIYLCLEIGIVLSDCLPWLSVAQPEAAQGLQSEVSFFFLLLGPV